MIGSDHELLLWGIGRPVWAAGHRSSTEVLELCIDTPSGMSNKPSQASPKPPVSGGLTGEQAKPQFCFFCGCCSPEKGVELCNRIVVWSAD